MNVSTNVGETKNPVALRGSCLNPIPWSGSYFNNAIKSDNV